MEKLALPSLIFFAVTPVFIGFILWIIGRAKKNRKLSHNGFIIMMISFVLIFLMFFTVFATVFYLYLFR